MGRPSPGTPILDDLLTLRLRFLIDRGYIVDGRHIGGTSYWNRNGRQLASMYLEVKTRGDRADLTISYTRNGTDKVEQSITLFAQPSNLGTGRGQVWYFICPGTGKRCRTLYFADGRFYSRRAFRNAMYYSQTESKIMRLAKPAPSPWPEGKPTTYRGQYTKAYLRYLKAEEAADEAIINLGRHMGWI